MKHIVDVGNDYNAERIRLEAERSGQSVQDWIVSFFARRCNAPSSSRKVQCTSGSSVRRTA